MSVWTTLPTHARLAVRSLARRPVFGISALDPLTLAAVSLLLVGAVLGATLIPAHRATRLDPARALRSE